MKTKKRSVLVSGFWILFILLGALASVVWVAAQSQQAGTETLKADVEIPPASFRSDVEGEAGLLPPDENPASPASEVASGQTFSYFTVSGPELRPRTTANDQIYGSSGCVYMSSGSSVGLLTGVGMHLPDTSVIKYIRLYYNDTNASAGVDAYLTRYAPGTAATDLVFTGSTNPFSGGYGFVVSSEITETVNTATYSYLLYGWPDSADTTLRVCGIRVAYYAPSIFGLALPTIIR